ncbi:MAG: PTS sugar transporter subunit IIA [Lentisphaerae bacterium]|jgi:nitrogen PTS system EIIA component|nr:PTS sugar transporter subunit IIA [Lentisphaerota bacterium]MBT4817134.1 PTS sugar transporter subunit IIA [Lentisphaerota bacterium]MBT5611622.1 PTS sugar transporter subunit IIA [Lentisphaerota bacterium]MBT7056607.1 PTS sugar transporter subunit IIA [Lentisphaerota bacterium]MBT7845863.1 PTS sugar transporter subunit IIA [Lentisphaerota bacterium]
MPPSEFSRVLTPGVVRTHMSATTKDEAIHELLDILEGAGFVSDRAAAERVVFERERVMSTGMECGIAIPHGKTDTVDRLVVAFGIKRDGLDFDCADGQPARIFIMTLSPASRSGPHIRFLAEVSRLLHDARVREQVLNATLSEDVVSALTGRS